VMEEIKRSPPAFIVQIFPLKDFPELQTFIRNYYMEDQNLKFSTPQFKINLYRRRPEVQVIPNPM